MNEIATPWTYNEDLAVYMDMLKIFMDTKILGYVPQMIFEPDGKHSVPLDSGIYLLMNRIKDHAESFSIPYRLMLVLVFFHEFGHLLVHDVSHSIPLSSDDRSNFEEPFCEMLSYYLIFTSFMENHSINVIGMKVRLKPSLFAKNTKKKIHVVKIGLSMCHGSILTSGLHI